MAMFEKLFKPGYIGQLKIKNRIIQAPMWTGFATRDGSVTPRLLNHYRERAQGGTGLIIVEYSYIDQIASQADVCQLGIYDNSLIPGLSTLARVIKDNGAKAGIQLSHAGRQRYLRMYPTVSSSRVPIEGFSDIIPSELSIEEIKEIIKAFGNAARIAEQSGFDMVEIHGVHDYLITNFLYPCTNRRGDMYGGDLGGRIRFTLEIVDSIRRNVSGDFPISMRISGSEYIDGGIPNEESQVFAQELERAGVNVIHVVRRLEAAPMYNPPPLFEHLAELIKKVVQTPIIAGGSITSPQLAEGILEKGWADFISLARPLLADPWLVHKAREGKPEDIVPCIRCNDGCAKRGYAIQGTTSCTVNATAGFEKEFPIQPASKSKKIAVIGGGPGGMEAARVAGLKGHQITLYEKRDRLGGYLNEASVPEFKKDLIPLIDYLSTQLEKLGVKVVLDKEATAQFIKGQGYEVVIVATGSAPLVPDIQGIHKKSVVTAIDVFKEKPIGQNVIVVGGGLIGCEVALFLAQKGKKIRIIELLDDIVLATDKKSKQFILERITEYGIQINARLRLEEVTEKGIIAVDRYGKEYNFYADSIVLAVGFVPNNSLVEELKQVDVTFYSVGDCVEPRRIYDAIHDGFLTGYRL